VVRGRGRGERGWNYGRYIIFGRGTGRTNEKKEGNNFTCLDIRLRYKSLSRFVEKKRKEIII
jgi:hypothetical protein